MYFAFHNVYHNVDLVLELHEILYIPFLVYQRWYYYYKDFEYDTSYVIVILVSVIVIDSIYFTYPLFFVDACLIHTY